MDKKDYPEFLYKEEIKVVTYKQGPDGKWLRYVDGKETPEPERLSFPNNCPECDAPWKEISKGYSETAVGYYSQPGHDHDDNCRRYSIWCENGHYNSVSVLKTCPACDWTGKTQCFCHEFKKVKQLPELPKVDKY